MSTSLDAIPVVLTEIQAGDGLGLPAAGRLFPGHRDNQSVCGPTVFRWVTRGTKTPDGRIVKLEAVRVGSRWVTSRAAVARYVAAITPIDIVAPSIRTPAQRHRAVACAEAECLAAGC